MRWQKRARLVLALAGFACAGAIYWTLGKRQPPAPLVAATTSDPDAKNETGPGDLDWESNGQESWRIRFDASSSYADGRTKFVRAHFATTRGSEPLELWADHAVALKRTGAGDGPGNIDLNGHVIVKTSSGWEIHTDRATYDSTSNMLRMPGDVTFARDLLTGSSTGATYDRAQQIMMLLADPHVVMQPDATGAGALDASADQITINRTDKFARLDQHAHIARDKEVLSADVANLRLTDDEKTVKTVELNGHASVVPKPGADNPPPEMHAADITLGMQPDGKGVQTGGLRQQSSLTLASTAGPRRIDGQSIDFRLAPDGQTLSKLDAQDNVILKLPQTPDAGARTITAQVLKSTGDDKAGLTSLRFDGAAGIVTFTEQEAATSTAPAQVRTGLSKTLTLVLDGDLGAIEQAEFLKQVKFTKGVDITATSERAIYREPKGQSSTLTLYSVEKAPPPRVVNDDLTIDGDTVVIDVDTNDLHGTGAVRTIKKPPSDPKAAQPKPGLFATDQELFGAGDTAVYSSKASEITYTSTGTRKAKVYQEDGNNAVSARSITVNTATNNLSAKGAIDSRFTTDPKPGAGRSGGPSSSQPTSYTVRAETMNYVDADRTARYTGAEQARAELQSEDGVTDAQVLDMFLEDDGRTVKKLIASGAVYTLSGTREASGDHLVWTEAAGTQPESYTMTGNPVYVKEPKDPKPPPGQPDCHLSLYPRTVTFSPSGAVNTPVGTAGQIQQSDQACSIQIPGKPGGS